MFWRLTLRKLYLLLGRHHAKQVEDDHRFWILVNFLYNSQIQDESKRITPDKVFPRLVEIPATTDHQSEAFLDTRDLDARESFKQLAKQFKAS